MSNMVGVMVDSRFRENDKQGGVHEGAYSAGEDRAEDIRDPRAEGDAG